MPFYDLKCKDCKHVWEVMESISKINDEHPCPKCNGTNTGVRISKTDFVFLSRKGSNNIIPSSPMGKKQ